MSDASESRFKGWGLVGVGAAACVGCCIGPIAAFFGSASVAGVAGGALFGIVGIAVVLVATIAIVVVRRHRRVTKHLGAPAAPTPMPDPTRRADAR